MASAWRIRGIISGRPFATGYQSASALGQILVHRSIPGGHLFFGEPRILANEAYAAITQPVTWQLLMTSK